MVGGTENWETTGPGEAIEAATPERKLRDLAASIAAAVVLCTGTAGVLAWLELGRASQVSARATLVLHVLGVALFLASGVLRLARWRIARDTRSLLMGSALVVLGGVSMPLTSLAGVAAPSSSGALLSPLTAVVTTLVSLALVALALRHGGRAGRLWEFETRGVLPVAILTAAAPFLVLTAAHVVWPELMTVDAFQPRLVRGTLLTLAWFGASLAAAMHGSQQVWTGRVAPLLGCMGAAEALRTLGAFHPAGWDVAAGALVVTIAALSASHAVRDLGEAIVIEPNADLRHDAQNALTGMRAALVTLSQFGSELDPRTVSRLRTAVLVEVDHLEHIFCSERQTSSTDFDLEPALRSVVETQRATGTRVELHGPAVEAHGRSGDLATVVQNLLVNAALHGEEPVVVSTKQHEDRVEVHVTDQGAGVHPQVVDSLFDRGSRSPHSTGSGLGLHIARRLMLAQGGDLQLLPGDGGCHFVCTLPTAKNRSIEPRHGIRAQARLLKVPGALVVSTAGKGWR
jgi:signal transduction histidine kinase